ncbi:MAG: hypothetical protein NVS9B4_15420 [Candidatus Acidiferrum sp.]
MRCILKLWLTNFWQSVRAWCGDSAYEGYLRCAAKSGIAPLSAEQFYLEQLNRRYSRPNRCC